MQDELELRLADEQHRLAAFRNVHEFWGRGLSLEEHLRRRQESVQHNRADWYVGCHDGQVVVSLGCYPFQFHVAGERLTGIGIGSVHTVPTHRRRGLAKRLLEWVHSERLRQGARLSMLYSDIDPAYYAKLGYEVSASHEGWSNGRFPPSNGLSWRPFDPVPVLRQLEAFYEAYHRSHTVAVARDLNYWDYLLKKSNNDQHLWLERDSQRLGYARILFHGERARIVDYALAQPDDELLLQLYTQAAQYALEKGVTLGGWLPNLAGLQPFFDIRPRSAEITMIKMLEPVVEIDDAFRGAADRFCEIDHV